MLATLVTGIVAVVALFSWKQQKLYEVKIEALAKSRSAIDLVKYLRSPVSYASEIDPGILDDWNKFNPGTIMNPVDKQAIIFHSKLKFHDATYKEMLFLRERIWANYSDEHPFYLFYDYAVQTIMDVSSAHNERRMIADKDDFPDDEYKLRRTELSRTVTAFKNDEITRKITLLYNNILKKRAKRKILRLFNARVKG